MYRKKQRGQMQKLKKLKKYLIDNTTSFPTIQEQYVHWHMPCRNDFLDSPKTSLKIKIQAMQSMIDSAQHLYTIKPKEIEFCRIVCIFTIPEIWSSQIVIFFDANYYNDFFDRKDDYQKWIEIQTPRLKRQINLKITPQFSEKYYAEEINDDGQIFKQHLWVYGELD